MKNLIKKSWVILLVGVLACTDLELKPKGSASSDVLLTSQAGYTQFLAKLYLGLAHSGQNGPAGAGDIATGDEGFSQYIRGLWNAEEMPTDEALTLWGDPGLKDYHAHSWTSNSAFLTQFYYRIFYQIALANIFLNEISDGNLTKRGLPSTFITGTGPNSAKGYRAEARLLRAMSYYHGLNYFRNIPFTDEKSSSTAKPPQKDAQFIFNYIESELKAIEGDLPPAKGNVYGRMDAATAQMILAKLYLNAEVYIGTPKYAECVTYLNKLIGKYSLAPAYQNNFLTDSQTSPEMIFAVPSEGLKSPNYGGVTLIINGAIGGALGALPQVNGRNPIMGNNQSWAGHRTTRGIVDLFPDVTGTLDKRALFYTPGQSLDVNDINQFTDGYMVTKFRNVDKLGNPGSDGTFTDTDFPLFRYADVLLMYAECFVRGGAGSGATQANAEAYFNAVRLRSYPTSATIPSVAIPALSLNLLLDERGREFYWEGHRRTDMIRFGVFSNNPTNNARGIWQWKGNVKNGRATESFRDIYPIPSSDVIANPNIKQNTGY